MRTMLATKWAAIPALLVLAVITVCAKPAQAGDSDWTVDETNGHVVSSLGGAEVALTVGDTVATGATVTAGAHSRAVLVRGESRMELAPGTRIEIAGDSTSQRTTIFQRLGTLLLDIQRRTQQHFEVQTPYLAAVVKGTSFSVSVDSVGAAVHVMHGAVEVSAPLTGDVQMVRPGQTATVSDAGRGVGVSGNRAGSPGAWSDQSDDGGPGPNADSRGLGKTMGQTDLDVAAATGGLASNGAPVMGSIDRESAVSTPGGLAAAVQNALGVNSGADSGPGAGIGMAHGAKPAHAGGPPPHSNAGGNGKGRGQGNGNGNGGNSGDGT